MIARIWRGWTRAKDADAYLEYLRATGLSDYRSTPGNRGAFVLRRVEEGRCEFTTLSLWDDLDSIRAFAGDDVERARFYPEDDRYLVARELRVTHHEAFEARPGSV